MKKIRTKHEFEQTIKSGFDVLVFKSEICPSCDAFDRYVAPLEALFPHINFYETKKNHSNLTKMFDVRGVPSLFVFKDGTLIASYNDGNHKTFMDVRNFLKNALKRGDTRCFSNVEKN